MVQGMNQKEQRKVRTSTYRVWRQVGHRGPMNWGGVKIIATDSSFSMEATDVRIVGDGHDLEELVAARKDVFGWCERLDASRADETILPIDDFCMQEVSK